MISIRKSLSLLAGRVKPSGMTVMVATALIVGAGTGLGAVLFIELIALVQQVLYQGGEKLLGWSGRWLVILIPMLGGLLGGPVIAYFASEAKGHGVPEVMKAIALRGGRIRPRVVAAKIVASALCIGSGGSAGREGPIVQTGAALGSAIGQWLHLSEARIRNLVACGAAAGIAATFNAPIAGVIFAMEIILGEMHLGDLGSVVLSAVTASTVARIFLGDRPAFTIPRYGMQTPWEILLFALLGVLAAFTAVFFIKILYKAEDLFDEWRFPQALKPAVGGLLLGVLGYLYPMALATGTLTPQEAMLGLPVSSFMPHVYGSGFTTIEGALLGGLPLLLLLALVFLKPLATSLTLGSGNSGGVFAPALFTGAALGGAFGKLVDALAPGLTAGAGAFATVGMAAVFAGAARAPFSAILIVFEMTDDYRLIVPLMAGVVVSMLVAERLHPESIYTLKLTRQGIHLKRGQDVDVMQAVRVEEVMVPNPEPVAVDMPVSELPALFLRTGRHGFPVVNPDGTLYGVVSLEDYRQAVNRQQGLKDLKVYEIATRAPLTVYPDETVGLAMQRMAPRDISRLPVVSRSDPRQLVGLVRRNDIVRAYELGVVRREEARRRAETSPSPVDRRAQFIEVLLATESGAVGKTIAALDLPRDVVLVSVRRGHELIIPHGDTRLQSGDVVTALCQRDCAEQVRSAMTTSEPPEG